MTSRAKHNESTAGKSLIEMIQDQLDEVMADRLVEGLDEYNCGIVDGAAGGLATALAIILDPYENKDRDDFVQQILGEADARLVSEDA